MASVQRFLLGKTAYLVISSTVILVLYFSSYQSHLLSKPIQGEQTCYLTKVVDGDTVELICPEVSRLHLRFRLQDIDAPEMGQGVWGQLSRQQLIRLLPSQLVVEFQGKDVYQRYLGILKSNGIDFNEMMLKTGMARVYKNYHPMERYLAAMAYAREKKLGIWSEQGLQQNPKRYRRLKN